MHFARPLSISSSPVYRAGNELGLGKRNAHVREDAQLLAGVVICSCVNV